MPAPISRESAVAAVGVGLGIGADGTGWGFTSEGGWAGDIVRSRREELRVGAGVAAFGSGLGTGAFAVELNAVSSKLG